MNIIKSKRIKISSLHDFKNELEKEGYKINEYNFSNDIITNLRVNKSVVERLYINDDITYRADNIRDFIDYIEKIILFENENKRLYEKINKIKKIDIHRIEYEREPSTQENVEHIINEIEEIKSNISIIKSEEEVLILEKLEKEINNDYIYAKDVELLKKMIIFKNHDVKETYNIETKIKTISIEIPEVIDYEYIKAKKGSVEYHEHLNNNIPRVQRLINNISSYIKENNKSTFKINQSEALQDSINIAVAVFNKKEFRAISGSNEIKNYCKAPPIGKATFKSIKVNKLGKLGIGYDRVNDSEKKILEEINKEIESKILLDEGNLVLYSKWEPCPSCYYVISQFCKKYPKINVEVKYNKRYGE